jgi:hypothetical protein
VIDALGIAGSVGGFAIVVLALMLVIGTITGRW